MTFDVKKYPGYTEMIFRNRKSTLTRKKALATFLTSDNLEVQLYDFYNKYHFFMKFDGFDPMFYGIRIYFPTLGKLFCRYIFIVIFHF